jgi:hypothetical protein
MDLTREDCVSYFNQNTHQLSDLVKMLIPTSFIAQHYVRVKQLLDSRVREEREKMIGLFVLYVLPKYRDQVIEGNDDFFMKYSFTEDSQGDSWVLSKIFEFKDIWSKLDSDNKQTVKDLLKIMCLLAEQYFLILDSQMK